MSFWPRKITILDILMNTLGALIAWFIGSIIIIFIVFMVSTIVDVPGTFAQSSLWVNNNPTFPFILSFITFIATMIMVMISVSLLSLTDGERYKKSAIIYSQVAVYGIITYICITPVYIYTGLLTYDNIMIVFIIHSLALTFGISLLLEILSNYRYILTWFYGSFIALFFTTLLVVILFSVMETGYAKLLSLLIILPLINTSLTFFKWVFELLYYKYYMFSNMDQLWDIFYQIEKREEEALREEEQKNTL